MASALGFLHDARMDLRRIRRTVCLCRQIDPPSLKEQSMYAEIDIPPKPKAKWRWTGSFADRVCTGISAIIGWEIGGWLIHHFSITFH